MTDINFLVIQQHAIHSLDRRISSLGSLIVDEAIALRATLVVSGDFARQDVAESGEGVVESLEAKT